MKNNRATIFAGKRISFVLILLLLISCSQTSKNEMSITTQSKEALKLFLDGRDKFENLEIQQAFELLSKATELDSNFSLAYLYQALNADNFNEGLRAINKATKMKVNASEGEKLFIGFLKANFDGDGVKQKELIKQLLTMYPEDKRILLWAGNHQYNINNFQKAKEYYEKAFLLDENFSPVYNMLGYTYASLEENEKAEQTFKTYISLIPDKANPYDSYAELLLKLSRYDESIQQYQKALEVDPGFILAYNGIGNNYIFMGDFDLARNSYQQRFDKAPQSGDKLGSLYFQALSYIHQGDINAALAKFNERRELAQKENQITTVILSHLIDANVLAESGKPAEGLKSVQTAMELLKNAQLEDWVKENMTVALMQLNCYCKIQNKKFDAAKTDMDKYKQLVEKRQDPQEMMQLEGTLGCMALKEKQYDNALQHFAKSNNQSPLTWYQMALAYVQKGDTENARQLLKKISNWTTNDLDLALVRNRAIDKLNTI